MPEPKLHLDADASMKALQEALLARGHDVTRTPVAWMPLDASDEAQLLGATAQGRCLFTFNVRDFMALAEVYPSHHGLILAVVRSGVGLGSPARHHTNRGMDGTGSLAERMAQ